MTSLIRLVCGVSLAAAATWASPPRYVYEGQWGSLGQGKGEFVNPLGVTVAPDGRVYVSDFGNHRVQYFTSAGSFLGMWGSRGQSEGYFNSPWGIDYGANGIVYVADWMNERVQYFKPNGSFLGSWFREHWYDWNPVGVAVADYSGYGYVTTFRDWAGVFRFTLEGYLVHWWPIDSPAAVAVGGNRLVYVVEIDRHRVKYFTPYGYLLGQWGTRGSGDGQFKSPSGVAVGPGGTVFVTDLGNDRVQFFTSTGSFLGKWGSEGTGKGQFNGPHGIAVSRSGELVYVTEEYNNRVQYFKLKNPAVAPASLGRVKALFK